jgi:hypothetical protein
LKLKKTALHAFQWKELNKRKRVYGGVFHGLNFQARMASFFDYVAEV